MDRLAEEFEHEELVVFRDPESGATGAIAIHSTVLGPAMGGLRLFRYPGLTDGLLDALRLARAMSFKSAAAGLDLGGGKAVLVDDGDWEANREERMRAVGRVIEGLGGRYITAEDVGTSPADMNFIAETTGYVAGSSADNGGSGDPSPYTARTVFGAIGLAVRIRLRRDGLDGVRVGVQGVGHVGAALVGLLVEAGAEVFVTDIDDSKAAMIAALHGATALPLNGFLYGEFDVLAPCAMGGAIGLEHVGRIAAPVIAGAANNPLVGPTVATALAAEGVLYVPDFIANCGGIIHVGAEALGLGEEEAEGLLSAADDHAERILLEATENGHEPLRVAEEHAQVRLRGQRKPAL
jgi:glutamate dehydrogenase/leucine dehydrogenase